jgi:hypothetical protein
MKDTQNLYKGLEEFFNDIDILFHEYEIELLNCEDCKPLKNRDLNKVISLLREAHEVIIQNV